MLDPMNEIQLGSAAPYSWINVAAGSKHLTSEQLVSEFSKKYRVDLVLVKLGHSKLMDIIKTSSDQNLLHLISQE